MDKFEARKKYRSLRDKFSEEDLLDSSVKIANNCLSLDIWQFHNYHIFLSIEKNKEIDTNPIINIINGKEKQVIISKSKKSFFHEQGCYPHQLEFDHKGIIVGSIGDLIGPVTFSSLCANEKLIKSDIGLKISKAFEESKKWVQNSDSKIVAESVKSYFPNFDTTSISNAVKDYQDLGTWNKGINISDEEYNKAQEVFKFSNLISKDYKIEDAVLYAEE